MLLADFQATHSWPLKAVTAGLFADSAWESEETVVQVVATGSYAETATWFAVLPRPVHTTYSFPLYAAIPGLLLDVPTGWITGAVQLVVVGS